MVNSKNKSKRVILQILRESGKTVSGEEISLSLGISRVAVWKQIKKLNELGYEIISSPKGYRLGSEQNHLYTWEFESEKENYRVYKSLNSTMEQARKIAELGCLPFTTIIAETQSAGKGRGERQWESKEGGLYFTSVLMPEYSTAYLYIYTFAASLAIIECIKKLYDLKCQIKWPNDILYEGKKLAGILTESHIQGDKINWLSLGVGINVNNSPRINNTCSIKSIKGFDCDRKILLTEFEDHLKKILNENSPSDIRDLWSQKSVHINNPIHLETENGEEFSGIVEAVDRSGSLIINKNNKRTQALYGDLYLKRGENNGK